MSRFHIVILFCFSFIYLKGQNAYVEINENKSMFGCLGVGGFGEVQLMRLNENKGLENQIKIYSSEIWKMGESGFPPMLGEYVFKNDSVFFCPRFPFKEGAEYVLLMDIGERKEIEFQVPHISKKEKIQLLSIYPTSDTVASNLLKIYLEFSAPMGLGNPYQYIFVLDENGNKVHKPFLEMEIPLWDKEQKRLTLWFDPGRIKSGLSPNEKMGPPLLSNKKYTIQISENWRDAFGQNISGQLKKEFVTISPDYEKPNPEKWKIIEPSSKTYEPLQIQFFENMDWAVLKNGIAIKNEYGKILEGEIEVLNHETIWQFIPKEKWDSGNYKIMLTRHLEDLAGNNLVRPFDREVEEKELVAPVLELFFEIKK